MLIFVQIAKHSPENCPIFNEEANETIRNATEKQEELASKHDVKMVGAWIVHSEHSIYEVWEAPSFEDFQKFMMEPEMAAVCEYVTLEVKPAMSIQKAGEILKQG